MNKTAPKNERRGFTLVELTVVVLIIGVIATIAAPKFFDSLNDAQDNAAVSTLATVRNSIELYKANNTAYPTFATLVADVGPMLQNGFPTCPVGHKNATIVASAVTPVVVEAGTDAWVYNDSTGEFRINHASYIAK